VLLISFQLNLFYLDQCRLIFRLTGGASSAMRKRTQQQQHEGNSHAAPLLGSAVQHPTITFDGQNGQKLGRLFEKS
jgi:hypothetical protein